MNITSDDYSSVGVIPYVWYWQILKFNKSMGWE
jgi:hypothetical protein